MAWPIGRRSCICYLKSTSQGPPCYQLFRHPFTSYHNMCPTFSPLGLVPLHLQSVKIFADILATQKLEQGEFLISFDVISLITNIPTDLVVGTSFRRLSMDNTLSKRTDLSVQSIASLLYLCLYATFLSF